MAKTTLQEVQERIKEMKDRKAADLEVLRTKQAEAQANRDAAQKAIKDATASMDLDAYQEAKDAIAKWQTAIDMYSGRHAQIEQKEFVTEEESTNVLASLVAYNDKLAETFRTALAEQLKALKALADNYAASVRETDQALEVWQRDIRANYISATAVYADGTRRSPRPVPISVRKCAEAERLTEYLNNASDDFRY